MNKNISFRCTLDTRYKKRGSAFFPVKLMITEKKDKKYIQRYIPTELEFTKVEWAKIYSDRPAEYKEKRDEIREIERRAEQISKKIVPFDFKKFEEKWNYRDNANTIDGAFKKTIAELEKEDRPGTASAYNSARVSIEKFRKGSSLTDVTEEFLKQYQKWITDDGNSITTAGIYLRALRAIVKKELDKELDPFGKGKFSPPAGAGNKRWLNHDVLNALYHYDGDYQKAKDFWFFSYFANGMNFKDICRLKYSNIDEENEIISYKRSKTIRTKKRAELIRLAYTDELKRIVEKYGTNGKDDDYVFPILKNEVSAKREMQLKDQFIHVVNNDLKKIADDLKIKNFTTYSARHSWASLQMNEGLSKSAIGKMLGHADEKTTEAYLGSLNVKTLKQASENAASFKKPSAKVVNL